MLKRTILTATFSVLVIYVIINGVYDGVYNLRTMVDAMFVVGMIMFFAGIILVTNITQVFYGISYTFKQAFSRKFKYKNYYDYMVDREKGKESTIGLPMLLFGLAYLIVSTYISYTQSFGCYYINGPTQFKQCF